MALRERLPKLDRCIIVEIKLVAEVARIFGEGRQRALPSRGVLALIFSRHRSRAGGIQLTVALSGDGQRKCSVSVLSLEFCGFRERAETRRAEA